MNVATWTSDGLITDQRNAAKPTTDANLRLQTVSEPTSRMDRLRVLHYLEVSPNVKSSRSSKKPLRLLPKIYTPFARALVSCGDKLLAPGFEASCSKADSRSESRSPS